MNARDYTVLFPFCGLGAGARGFLDAQITMFGRTTTFRSLGGIDNDPLGCADFEYLTDSPALCADVATLTPDMLRAFAGDRAPDVVFLSPPCKSFSGLMSKELAATPKYEAMSRLVLDWFKLMLGTWAAPPRICLLENVPRIASRGKPLLAEVKKLLRKAGYLFHEGTHDCGELGGLAQHRQRFLLVARHGRSLQPLLYQPVTKRVRACGEVIGPLPMPEDPAGGPMHTMPKLSWLNWVRLALIPAGGDWRDLAGVLADGQPRREVHRRHRVEKWSDPSGTITGSGSNAVGSIADPRIALKRSKNSHDNLYRVEPWAEPSHTVTGATRPGAGAISVADPRNPLLLSCEPRAGAYGVAPWTEPSKTVTGSASVDNGSVAVADPREPFGNVNRVTPWDKPVGTITHSPAPSSGAPAAADPRVRVAYDHGYGVLRWDEPSSTVAGGSHVGQGAYSVADLRIESAFGGRWGVMDWQAASATVTGQSLPSNGAFTIADPRKPPPSKMVIIAADGTWHRPLTTYELAALQGMPTTWKGKPLTLAGKNSTGHRERVGNAVPPPTARAIAEQMLVCLTAAEVGGFALSSGGAVWVERRGERVRYEVMQ